METRAEERRRLRDEKRKLGEKLITQKWSTSEQIDAETRQREPLQPRRAASAPVIPDTEDAAAVAVAADWEQRRREREARRNSNREQIQKVTITVSRTKKGVTHMNFLAGRE